MSSIYSSSIGKQEERLPFFMMFSVFLGFSLLLFAGCGQPETPPGSEGTSDGEKTASGDSSETEPPAALDSDPPGFQVPTTDDAAETTVKPPIEPMVGLTAEELLQSMATTYREAQSYADHGYLDMKTEPTPSQGPLRLAYTVAYEKPNKIRMQIGYGILVCDGEQRFGSSAEFPTQVLDLPAPPELTIEDLYPDPLLAEVMDISLSREASWLPLQILLLFTEDPLKTLVPDEAELQMLSPEWLGESPCERLQMTIEGRKHVLWIDRHRRLLLRYEFPHDALPPPPEVEKITRVAAEMPNAQVNVEINPEAFQLAVPENTRHVPQFEPKALAMLGKQVEEISLLDLENQAVPLSSLDQEATLLVFWSTKSPPCRTFMPEIYRLYETFREDDRVKIAGVSVDEAQVADKTLKTVLQDWGTPLPTYRVGEDLTALQRFSITAIPTIVLLDAEKKIVLFHQGVLAGSMLQERLEAQLEGKHLIEQAQKQFTEFRTRFREEIRAAIQEGDWSRTSQEAGSGQIEILPKRLPEQIAVNELWENSAILGPGNILVLENDEGPPNILVPCEGNALAMLDTTGKILRKVKPESSEGKPITFVRAIRDAQGRRMFAATAMTGTQIHLLDEELHTLGTYPEKPISSGGAMIADARLTELNGDGHPDLVIGYFGAGGVEAVTLEDPAAPKSLWKDTSVINAFRVGLPPTRTPREILAMNVNETTGTLERFGPDGKKLGTLKAPDDQPIAWFAVDDLDRNGDYEMCVLIPSEETEAITAMGLDASGTQLWSYPFPVGAHAQPIEQIVSGDLVGDDTREWILASADGVIHLLNHQGELIDQFATGEELAGMAAASWEGKKILLVSDTGRLIAWEISMRETPETETQPDLPPATPPTEPGGTTETTPAPLVPTTPAETLPPEKTNEITPPKILPSPENASPSPPEDSQDTVSPPSNEKPPSIENRSPSATDSSS